MTKPPSLRPATCIGFPSPGPTMSIGSVRALLSLLKIWNRCSRWVPVVLRSLGDVTTKPPSASAVTRGGPSGFPEPGSWRCIRKNGSPEGTPSISKNWPSAGSPAAAFSERHTASSRPSARRIRSGSRIVVAAVTVWFPRTVPSAAYRMWVNSALSSFLRAMIAQPPWLSGAELTARRLALGFVSPTTLPKMISEPNGEPSAANRS